MLAHIDLLQSFYSCIICYYERVTVTHFPSDFQFATVINDDTLDILYVSLHKCACVSIREIFLTGIAEFVAFIILSPLLY